MRTGTANAKGMSIFMVYYPAGNGAGYLNRALLILYVPRGRNGPRGPSIEFAARKPKRQMGELRRGAANVR